jgi:hypothetical protein
MHHCAQRGCFLYMKKCCAHTRVDQDLCAQLFWQLDLLISLAGDSQADINI